MAGSLNISREHKEDGIVQILEDAFTIKKIENTYRQIKIKDVSQDMDFSTCFVKGVLVTVYPSLLTSKGLVMKLSIKDASSGPDPVEGISVFLRGKFVEKCKIMKEKDVLMITGAKVESSPRDGHQFEIIGDEKSCKFLRVWVVRNPNYMYTATGGVVQRPLFGTTDCAAIGSVKKTGTEPPSKRSRLILQPQIVKYTKLADIRVNTIVNVFGVVKFFKSPFKTKGSDFVCSLSLVDSSLASLEESFKLVLFSKSKERLPFIRSIGDIVRFHNVAVGNFRGEMQGKFLPTSTWLVFDVNSTDNYQPQASSLKSCNLTEQEKDAIKELQLWASQKESLSQKFVITNLKDLSTSQTFVNLLCQVVSKSYTEASKGVTLTLWDGSLPACQSTSVEPVSEQGQLKSDELIRKSADKFVEVFLYDNHVEGEVRKVSPGDLVCIRNVHIKELEAGADKTTDKPELALSRPHVSLIVHGGTICGRGVEIVSVSNPMVSVSSVMKLIAKAEASATYQHTEQQSEGTVDVHDGSKTTDSCEIQQEKDNFNKQRDSKSLITNEVNRALQTSCTITEHPSIPFSSLKEIKTCKTVPYKFRCRVKAVMYLPSDVKSFTQRSCHSCKYLPQGSTSSVCSATVNDITPCSLCGQEMTLSYLFSFVLEDDSGLLHAMVFDKDAKTFFPGLPLPEEFSAQASLQETIQEWMLSMTNNPNNSIECVNQDPKGDKRPWLELCIFSYLPDEDCQKVQYRVFDSTFVHDN